MTARLTCVTWHEIAPSSGPASAQLGATTSPDAFAAQLDHLQRHYRIVDLDRVLSNNLPPRAALLTFDDAYASIARVAAPMLAQRSLPSVLFVNPGPVAHGLVPLDALASVVATQFGVVRLAALCGAKPNASLTFGGVLDGCVAPLGRDARARLKLALLDSLSTSEAALHRGLDLFMTPAELKVLPPLGMEVANHTYSHVHCGALDVGGLQVEVIDAKGLIEDLTGTSVRAFAFPWGRKRDATEAAMHAIRTSGHRASFLVHGRNNAARPADDVWYRVLLRNERGARLTAALTLLPQLREWKASLAG